MGAGGATSVTPSRLRTRHGCGASTFVSAPPSPGWTPPFPGRPCPSPRTATARRRWTSSAAPDADATLPSRSRHRSLRLMRTPARRRDVRVAAALDAASSPISPTYRGGAPSSRHHLCANDGTPVTTGQLSVTITKASERKPAAAGGSPATARLSSDITAPRTRPGCISGAAATVNGLPSLGHHELPWCGDERAMHRAGRSVIVCGNVLRPPCHDPFALHRCSACRRVTTFASPRTDRRAEGRCVRASFSLPISIPPTPTHHHAVPYAVSIHDGSLILCWHASALASPSRGRVARRLSASHAPQACASQWRPVTADCEFSFGVSRCSSRALKAM